MLPPPSRLPLPSIQILAERHTRARPPTLARGQQAECVHTCRYGHRTEVPRFFSAPYRAAFSAPGLLASTGTAFRAAMARGVCNDLGGANITTATTTTTTTTITLTTTTAITTSKQINHSTVIIITMK